MIGRTVVAVLLLAPCLTLAATNPAELHKKARARMKSLDFEAALPLLEQLRELPDLGTSLRGQVLVDLGITFVNVGRTDDARKAFDNALDADPEVPFPSGVPPKIRRMFDEAKQARLAPPPAPVAVVPEPVAPAPLPPAPVAPKVEPPPALAVAAQPPPRERRVAVPVILVVAGAGAIGAAVGTALASQGANRELSASLHSSGEAQALLSRRASFGISSYVCYGLGAALLATGATVFAFSGGGQQVSAVVTPSGGAVTVSGEF